MNGYSGLALRLAQVIFSLTGVTKDVEELRNVSTKEEQVRIWREKLMPVLLNPLVVALLKTPSLRRIRSKMALTFIHWCVPRFPWVASCFGDQQEDSHGTRKCKCERDCFSRSHRDLGCHIHRFREHGFAINI